MGYEIDVDETKPCLYRIGSNRIGVTYRKPLAKLGLA